MQNKYWNWQTINKNIKLTRNRDKEDGRWEELGGRMHVVYDFKTLYAHVNFSES